MVSGTLAQQWQRQSAYPTARNLTGVSFVTPLLGFASGDSETLLRTRDGGITWQNISPVPPNSDPLYNVFFRDSLNGWALGNNIAWRTADGGDSWSQISSVPAGSWRAIDFVSASTAFMGGSGALIRSTDGGITWQVRTGYPDCPIVFGMDFWDANLGLVGGTRISPNDDGIYKTIDGGATWSQVFPQSANDVMWLSSTSAIAIVGTNIYRSFDSGNTWMLYGSGITTGLDKFARIDANTIAGVSLGGDIWRSSNSGQTWTQVLDGPGALPASWRISFSDSLHGKMVGQSGFIYKSDDGGFTWTQINNGVGVQLYEMSMFDSQRALAAGQNGYIFRTTNAGAHWDVLKVEVTGQVFGRDESLKAVCTVGSNFAVVAGPGGTVFKSLDGGISWQNIGFPQFNNDYLIEDVKFTSPSDGWVTGTDYTFGIVPRTYHTTNGGMSWVEGGPSGACIEFSDSQHGWISAGGYVNRTIDGGQTWQSVGLPTYFTSPQIDEIKFLDANTGWAVGWFGLVAKTTNGGVTWAYQNLPQNMSFFAIAAVSPQELYISGRNDSYDAILFHTTNGGTTWQQVASPATDWFVGMAAQPDGNVWGVGTDGLVSHLSRLNPSLSGTVTLQDFTGSVAGRQVVVEIRNVGSTTAIDTQTVTLSATGAFALTSTVAPGTYDITVKGSHWLRRKASSITVTSSGATGLTFSLINGDVNGDNVVSLGDLGALRLAFSSSAGDPTWNANADLNGDGAVSLGDLGILRSRFGQAGEN